MKSHLVFLSLAVATVPLFASDSDPVADIQRAQHRQMQLHLQAEQVRIQQEQLELHERQVRQAEERRQAGNSHFDQELARRHREAGQGSQLQQQAIQNSIREDAARRDFERQKELIRVRAQAEAQARAQANAEVEAQRRAERVKQEQIRREQEAREGQFVQQVEQSYARMEKRYPDFAEGGKHFDKFQEFLVKNAPATLGDMSQATFPEVYAEKYAALIRLKPRE